MEIQGGEGVIDSKDEWLKKALQVWVRHIWLLSEPLDYATQGKFPEL